MAKVNVEIVTPEKRLVKAEVDEAIVPGAQGLFGVRPGHAPFLSVMEPGPLTLKEGANSQTYFVAGGFVTVSADRVLVLADQAEAISAIDVEAARRRHDEAQKRLSGMSADDARFELESAVVRREAARMALAKRA